MTRGCLFCNINFQHLAVDFFGGIEGSYPKDRDNGSLGDVFLVHSDLEVTLEEVKFGENLCPAEVWDEVLDIQKRVVVWTGDEFREPRGLQVPSGFLTRCKSDAQGLEASWQRTIRSISAKAYLAVWSFLDDRHTIPPYDAPKVPLSSFGGRRPGWLPSQAADGIQVGRLQQKPLNKKAIADVRSHGTVVGVAEVRTKDS